MNWLKRKLINWLSNSEYDNTQPGRPKKRSGKFSGHPYDDDALRSEPFKLNIYQANGGTIVETIKYDHENEQAKLQLHIIRHDEELGHGLAKIITIEALRG